MLLVRDWNWANLAVEKFESDNLHRDYDFLTGVSSQMLLSKEDVDAFFDRDKVFLINRVLIKKALGILDILRDVEVEELEGAKHNFTVFPKKFFIGGKLSTLRKRIEESSFIEYLEELDECYREMVDECQYLYLQK